ncbi:hypothetical protein B484DRAFT_407181 [Ochromonadaceae sp. CCMP2298]|nr:hypothetical protein B484DRAFT_407181 [Ochromonadaceae sp. CCMP2298]
MGQSEGEGEGKGQSEVQGGVTAYSLVHRVHRILSLMLPRAVDQITPSTANTTVNIPTQSLSLTISTLAAFAAVNVDLPTSTVLGLLEACLARTQTALGNDSQPVSALQASSLLQAMTTVPNYPQLLQREGGREQGNWEQGEQGRGWSADRDRDGDRDQEQEQGLGLGLGQEQGQEQGREQEGKRRTVRRLLVWEHIARDPRWHRVAGRLAVRCTLGAAEARLESGELVSANWALALLGHTYYPLLLKAQTDIQTNIQTNIQAENNADNNADKTPSPDVLARLVVALAAGRAALWVGAPQSQTMSGSGPLSGMTGGLGGLGKVDSGFVDATVAASMRTIGSVRSLRDAVQALVAAAGLGRRTLLEGHIPAPVLGSGSGSGDGDGSGSAPLAWGGLGSVPECDKADGDWFPHSIIEREGEGEGEVEVGGEEGGESGVGAGGLGVGAVGAGGAGGAGIGEGVTLLGQEATTPTPTPISIPLHLHARKLSYLSSKALIKLHWALGCLPAGTYSIH